MRSFVVLGGIAALIACEHATGGQHAADESDAAAPTDAAALPASDANADADADADVSEPPRTAYGGPSGVLDVSFGGKGFVLVPGWVVHGVATDAQDHPLGAGLAGVWRVRTDGILDPTFGSSGSAPLAWEAWYVVLDGQGRALVGGRGDDALVTRLTKDGQPDPTWSKATVTSARASAPAFAAQVGDGGIYVAGLGQGGLESGYTGLVWRFASDGALDTTCSMRIGESFAGQGLGEARALAIDSQQRIIVGARTLAFGGPLNPKGLVARFTPACAVDTPQRSVNIAGSARSDVMGVTVDAQDRIIVCGSYDTADGHTRGYVGRLASSDALADATFGGTGYVTLAPPSENLDSAVTACAVDKQGRIVAVGSTTNGPGGGRVAAWRLTEQGTLDTTFATNGLFTSTGAAGGTADAAWGVAIDSLGCVVIGGESKDKNGTSDGVLWRLTP